MSGLWFENDVKMYGTQTNIQPVWTTPSFENDVKMYGTQTFISHSWRSWEFENDVKMYGTQIADSPTVVQALFENDVNKKIFSMKFIGSDIWEWCKNVWRNIETIIRLESGGQ